MAAFDVSPIVAMPPVRRRPWKRIAFALLFLTVALPAWYAVLSAGSAPVKPGRLVIPAGATARDLPTLAGADVPAFGWRAWLRLNAPALKPMAGAYDVATGTTLATLVADVLSKPPITDDVSAIILPGWNLYDLDEALKDGGIAGPDLAGVVPGTPLFEKLA